MMVDTSVAAPGARAALGTVRRQRRSAPATSTSPLPTSPPSRQRAAGGCQVLGLRYEGDPAVGKRFETLTKELGDAFIKVEFPGRKHGTLTEHRQQEGVDAGAGVLPADPQLAVRRVQAPPVARQERGQRTRDLGAARPPVVDDAGVRGQRRAGRGDAPEDDAHQSEPDGTGCSRGAPACARTRPARRWSRPPRSRPAGPPGPCRRCVRRSAARRRRRGTPRSPSVTAPQDCRRGRVEAVAEERRCSATQPRVAQRVRHEDDAHVEGGRDAAARGPA